MCQKNRKIKAFTLVELLIGMVVSLLVIAFSYLAFQMVNKQFLQQRDHLNKQIEHAQFNALIIKDIKSSDYWELTSPYECSIYSIGTEINYLCEDDYLLRSQNDLVDTFLFEDARFWASKTVVEKFNCNRQFLVFEYGEQNKFSMYISQILDLSNDIEKKLNGSSN